MTQELQKTGRIGLLVPSSNTTVEAEFYRALPQGVTVHAARLFLTRIAPESILRMVEDMETQAKLLATADVDVIVLGATAPSFLKGLGYSDAQITVDEITGIGEYDGARFGAGGKADAPPNANFLVVAKG